MCLTPKGRKGEEAIRYIVFSIWQKCKKAPTYWLIKKYSTERPGKCILWPHRGKAQKNRCTQSERSTSVSTNNWSWIPTSIAFTRTYVASRLSAHTKRIAKIIMHCYHEIPKLKRECSQNRSDSQLICTSSEMLRFMRKERTLEWYCYLRTTNVTNA